MIYFLRDDNNNLLGFTYQGNTYYYKKNAFDDIIGIYDSNYKEVCTYCYDAYDNILSIKDNNDKDITDTSNIALINPFRYRSYYYDTKRVDDFASYELKINGEKIGFKEKKQN